MSAVLRADDSAHTINSNFACCRVEGWEHDFNLNLCLHWRIPGSKYK